MLADPRLDDLQLVLLDELCEWVDLLLVKESDKVVAEAAHLWISVQQTLLNETFLAQSLQLTSLVKTLLLTLRFGVGAFTDLFLEDKSNECPFFLAF